MKKGLRITLRVFVGLIVLFICAWIFLWAYITYNKAGIIAKVKAAISKQVKGKVEIRDLSIEYLHNFPNISVRLYGVSIRDAAWDQHHHDFLKAENIYVRMQLFSLFSGSPSIGKVMVEKAQVYFYTDSTGYNNLVKANGAVKNKGTSFPELVFKDTRLIMDYPSRNKYHDIELKELFCNVISSDSGLLLNINVNALVHGLGFNIQKGSYLAEKSLRGDFDLNINATKDVSFNKVRLVIDKQPFLLSGSFSKKDSLPLFSLSIKTEKIDFKKAVGLLTQTTQHKFDGYNILDPIDITAELNGLTIYKSIPLVNIGFAVKDADIETKAGRFNDCSFTGNFTNQVNPALPRLDNNSMLAIKQFSGKWENIPLTANAVQVSNLTQPFLACDLHSSFALEGLNELTGSNSIKFVKGNGEMNIDYRGSLVNNDSIPTQLNGDIRLKDAQIDYLPRNISFKNLQGKCNFKNNDLFIEQLQTNAGTTALNMNGTIRNLLALVFKDPEKLVIEWNVSTPYLDLVDFMAFIGKNSAVAKKSTGKNKLINAANKIDRMLEYGTARLNIQAGKLRYKKFTATNIATSISLLQNEIVLNSAKLNHAGGSILLNGSLSDKGRTNLVKIKSTISNVDIPSLFTAFNNFGQDAITAQNMKGQLSANVSLNTSISEKGSISGNNLQSTVNFSVLNAELNDFEPLQKISVSIFKKRDFSRVRFAELKDKFEINGSAINIDKMEIRSNVFTMFVEGVYDTKKGTDMIINVPLRNLKKIDDDEVVINKGKAGVNVKLHAKTGDDGKLKISWDPFEKGKNNIKKIPKFLKKSG